MTQTLDQETFSEESGFELGLAFFELEKDFRRLPRPTSLSIEDRLDWEMNLIDNGIEAFSLATGIAAYSDLDVSTIAALYGTNRPFNDKLQALIRETLRDTKFESGGPSALNVGKSEMLASLSKVSALKLREWCDGCRSRPVQGKEDKAVLRKTMWAYARGHFFDRHKSRRRRSSMAPSSTCSIEP